MGIFMVSSVGCGFANSFWSLLLWRIAMGAGEASIINLTGHLFHAFLTCARQAQQAHLGTHQSNHLSPTSLVLRYPKAFVLSMVGIEVLTYTGQLQSSHGCDLRTLSCLPYTALKIHSNIHCSGLRIIETCQTCIDTLQGHIDILLRYVTKTCWRATVTH